MDIKILTWHYSYRNYMEHDKSTVKQFDEEFAEALQKVCKHSMMQIRTCWIYITKTCLYKIDPLPLNTTFM